MLQQKSEDRITSKELKKLVNKCDINNDIIIEEIKSDYWKIKVIIYFNKSFYLD